MRRDAEFEPEGVARVDIHHIAGRRITNVALVRWGAHAALLIQVKGVHNWQLGAFCRLLFSCFERARFFVQAHPQFRRIFEEDFDENFVEILSKFRQNRSKEPTPS